MTSVPETSFTDYIKMAGYDAKLYFVDAEKDDYRLFAEFSQILVYWDIIESRKSPSGYGYTYRYTLSEGTIDVVKYLEIVNYSGMLEKLFGMHDTYKTEIHFQVKNCLAKLKGCTPILLTLEMNPVSEKIFIDSLDGTSSWMDIDVGPLGRLTLELISTPEENIYG
jgi:hypothetical protein